MRLAFLLFLGGVLPNLPGFPSVQDSGNNGHAEVSQQVGSPTCSIGPPESTPLILGGLRVYVNPETMAVDGDRLAISGFPNHVWDASGETDAPRSNRLFGVVVGPDGAATPIPLPLEGQVGYPFLTPRGDGSLFAVFAEMDPGSPSGVPEALNLWSGIWRREGWSNLERLPVPATVSVRHMSRRWGSLVVSGDAVWFSLLGDTQGRLILFRYDESGWKLVGTGPEEAASQVLHVGWHELGVNEEGAVFLAFTQSEILSGGGGFALKFRPDFPRSHAEQDLSYWNGPLTISRFEARVARGVTSILVEEPGPTLYSGPTGAPLDRIPIRVGAEEADSHLVVLPDGPAVALQPRGIEPGAEVDLTFHRFPVGSPPLTTVIHSPLRVLQSAIHTDGELVLVGMVGVPQGPPHAFATDVLRFPVVCGQP